MPHIQFCQKRFWNMELSFMFMSIWSQSSQKLPLFTYLPKIHRTCWELHILRNYFRQMIEQCLIFTFVNNDFRICNFPSSLFRFGRTRFGYYLKICQKKLDLHILDIILDDWGTFSHIEFCPKRFKNMKFISILSQSS